MRKEVLALWERQDDRLPVDGGDTLAEAGR